MSPDRLEVVDGQDVGARLTIRRGRSTIGRGRLTDLLLTDPSVGEEHARLHRDAARLLIAPHDGRVAVNGLPISGPTPLRHGDRITLGLTVIEVGWPQPPPPPEAAPARRDASLPRTAPASAVAEDLTGRPVRAPGRPAALLAVGAAALALLGTWMPLIRTTAGDTQSPWRLGAGGLGLQALLTGLAALGAAVGWAWSAGAEGRRLPRCVPPTLVALAGGAVCGLPLFAITTPIGDGGRRYGVVVLLLAGLVLVLLGAAGAITSRSTDRTHPGAELVIGLGGGAGGLVAAIAAPLSWFSTGLVGVGGFDPALRTGWVLLPLALLVGASAGLTPAAAGLGRPGLAFPLAITAAVLSIAALALVTATAAAFVAFESDLGLLLALLGTGLAGASCASGLAAILAVEGERRPG